jgi:hypothetical protein
VRWRRLSRCYKPSFEPLRCGLRVLGAGDRAHDDDSASARRQYLGQPLFVDPADREPRFVRCQFGGGPDEVQARRGATRFRRSRPARADAEVVRAIWASFGRRGGRLRAVVGGPADHRALADDATGDWQRQVVLAQVQHGGAGGTGDVGAASSSCRASSGPNRCSPGEPLSRSWMMSTPPASAASANSARSPRSRRASVQRYSNAVARRSRGSCTPRR